MNTVLKFKHTNESKVWFISDTHWNHNPKWLIPLWKARGYTSVEESNVHQISQINSMVGENDTLIHLGDITLNCDDRQFDSFINQLICKNIHLLWGNHNNPVEKIYRKAIVDFTSCYETSNGFQLDSNIEIYPFRYKNLVFIGNYAEVIVNGTYFVLSHYPIVSWNHMKPGSIHLYGHQHCKNNPVGGRQMDVGWDGQLEPYSYDQIVAKMSKIEIKSDGGHH